MARPRYPAGPVGYVLTVAVVALGYYGAGRIGLELAYLNGAVAALWPPAGLGLAVLFLYGVRLWPAIVIGDLLLGDYSTPLGTVLAQTLGNTVALVAAALLLRRLTGGRCGLERVADVLAFVASALVAAVVSAAFGPLSLRLGDVIPADELGEVSRTWTLGDAAASSWSHRSSSRGRPRVCGASTGGSSWRARSCSPCWWRWRSCRHSAMCPTSSSRSCCGRRSASGRAEPPRPSSSSARSRSGTRRRTTGRSCATRSPTACSRRSCSSPSRRSRRWCSRRRPPSARGRVRRSRQARRPSVRLRTSRRRCAGWPRSSRAECRRAACSVR